MAWFRTFKHALIVVGSLVSIAVLFALRLFLAGAAPVAEFLLITGGTDAAFTCFTVIGRSAGIGESAVFLRFF